MYRSEGLQLPQCCSYNLKIGVEPLQLEAGSLIVRLLLLFMPYGLTWNEYC